MYHAIIISTFLSIALLISCSESATGPTEADLVGIWDWTESFGGNLAYQNPELCECTSRYEFTPNQKFAHYFSGEKLDSGAYAVEREYSDFLNREIDVLYLNEMRLVFEFRGENLIFIPDWRCLACPDSSFYSRSYVVPEK